MPGEAAVDYASPLTRVELMRWLWPHCDHGHVALQYLGDEGELRPGWIHDEADANRAIKAFAAGTLHEERFETATKQGVAYAITGAQRLGLVPHRNGMVGVFCVDLDDHTGDGGNVPLYDSIVRFFGAEPVVFTSKGGKGLHAFYQLRHAVPVEDFRQWSRSWRFNRMAEGRPELFPKSTGCTQVWMPGEPNDRGGDAYRSGNRDGAIIGALPPPLPVEVRDDVLSVLFDPPSEGARNEACNIIVFEFGLRRAGRDAAWAVCQWWIEKNGYPLEHARSTFESGYQSGLNATPYGAVINRDRRGGNEYEYELDGIGNADLFVSMHGHDAKFCAGLNQWFVWDITRWSPDQVRVEAMAKLTAQSIEDPTHRKKSSTKRGVEEMLFLARSDPGMAVRPEQFDGDPWLFNCLSGTIELRTGSMRGHARTDLLSKVSPVRYDPGGVCPVFLRFIDTVCGGDDELIDYIQRVCGYMLTGDTGEQCMFFLYGDGCNGKSVLAALLQHILGGYVRKIPSQMLSRQDRAAGEGATPFLTTLIGARLAVASELEEGQRLAEAKIKDMTGGDRMIGRGLHKGPVEFDPMFKMLIYGNHKPEISGTDHGIWRRIHLIPFTVTIPQADRDPHLLDKLKDEAGAILAWMVQGCLEWQRDRLNPPSAVLHATDGFKTESDVVGRFIEDRCTLADGVYVSKGQLFKAYRAWCEATGETPLGKNPFGTRITQRGIAEKRNRNDRLWVGVELSTSEGDGDA